MKSSADTVEAYILGLPEDRQKAVSTLRSFILEHLPPGYIEGMQYGMISYFIPLDQYPATYNGEPLSYIALASQKNYISLYLMAIYTDNEEDFRAAYKRSGKKLNMGKSCIRFKKFEDLPTDLLAETIRAWGPQKFIRQYETMRG